uniref:CD1d molecule n=1 Tax=Rhinolophus ferrumequinum TaxID=59479 RepID=A0A671G7P0_RHIFE
MEPLPFLLLWGLPQIWGSSEGESQSLTPQNIACSSCPGSPILISLNYGSLSNPPFFGLYPFFSSDPFELQVFAGCEVHPGSTAESFFHTAFQGRDVLSFQGNSWVPAPDAPHWVKKASKVLNQDQGTRETMQWLLNDICPQFVRGLLEAGQPELEKQVKPEAWLSSGPSPGPGRLLLVCHVMWIQGEQEQLGTQQSDFLPNGDFLPNADGTWYLRVTLDVAAGEAAGLTCRVRHSSLGGQDIILYWGSHVSAGLIIMAVLLLLVSLLLIGGGLTFWFKKLR